MIHHKENAEITTPIKHPRVRKGILISVAALLSVLIVFFGIHLYKSNFIIEVTNYTLDSEKIDSPVRLAVISDLHSRVFKSKNEALYAKLKDEDPHVILLVGDALSRSDRSDKDITYLREVIQNLCEIAPVYYSIGNHERTNPRLEDIKTTAVSSGAVLLDKEYTEIALEGNTLTVGGISYYRFWDQEANDFLTDYVQSADDNFTLLLCHNPEFYLWGIEDYPIDLGLSGHTHAGQIRLPFIGALYAPEQGFFPEYDKGFFEMENGHLAITSGLGSSPQFVPRINNPPEIMIIDVT